MTPLDHDRNESDEPSPRDRELMAYLDGELGPEDRARVEARLAAEPTTAGEVDADQWLRDLFDQCTAEPPSASKWKKALNRIEAGVAAAKPARASKVLNLAAWFTAAAALLAGVWLAGTHWRDPGPQDSKQPPDNLVEVFEVVGEDDVVIDDMDPLDVRSIVRGFVPATAPDELFGRQPLQVVSADEVSVITMDGNDTDVLVVGEPPVAGNLIMVRRGDVRVDSILSQSREEMRPYLHEPGGMPMIMMPTRTVRRD